ncbi:MAG: hypothetical protein A4S12_13560 [Proteobacteria bacterium SG_bin5]|nr:DUF1109 domain-containing protein [Sphingomonas sp.]OQW44529.1 MAG: hypothetical protein A4S12_13560 [Proteobacteria bacterium SG_bin5]
MRTEELIQSLAASTRPVPRHAVEQRVLAGLLLGAAGAFALIAGGLGLRGDLPSAMMQGHFLMKWGYSLSLGVIAVMAVLRAARPESPPWRSAWLLAVPVVLLMVGSVAELAAAPADHRMAMVMGHSNWQCMLWVSLLSLPIFAGLLWAFRRFAPTRLRTAGAALGVTAGATSAAIYALHCSEVTATFVVTWYSLGIAIAAAIGALAGPRLLRW